ncbi:GGDEF domain-containing protein [Massilia niastensis]|uniref:GGDEF domain-containing protein n=1 Tax=Massilia niastensis TaxID=544911 RepID=UPI00037A6F37|nr:GGDEF domain-containing protein [Massilia niastensis]
MRKPQAEARQLGPAQLRVLLTLSRELLQADEAGSSLELVGRALAEMIRPDSALLLLRGERLDIVGFDNRGVAHPAGTGHALYQTAMALLSGVGPAVHDKAHGNRRCEHVGQRTLALAVPAHAAIAALAVAWDHEPSAAELDRCRQALSHILELTAAALGKIEARSSLERLVWDQREQIAHSSDAHAAELARRDETATKMRMLSLTDVLTGLYNRRGFFLQAEQVFKVAQRKHANSAVIFADIDGLKRVNDDLGHDMGDRLIRDAAIVFRQSFRQADVVSRLGGDEFVAYTLDDEQPEAILARIRARLRAFNLSQERPYSVSISVGVVQCDPGGAQTLSHYVQLADRQMYAQKRSRLH